MRNLRFAKARQLYPAALGMVEEWAATCNVVFLPVFTGWWVVGGLGRIF
jgi:hypothetical protein